CLPSPLKSSTTTDVGVLPTPKLVTAPKPPMPLPNKIDRLFETALNPLGTARSCLPSPLKSPTATAAGAAHMPRLVAALKSSAPLPNKIDTSFEPTLATTRSCLPSPLKSPTAAEKGLLPTAKLVAALKLPAPLPNKIDTLLESRSTTARS